MEKEFELELKRIDNEYKKQQDLLKKEWNKDIIYVETKHDMEYIETAYEEYLACVEQGWYDYMEGENGAMDIVEFFKNTFSNFNDIYLGFNFLDEKSNKWKIKIDMKKRTLKEITVLKTITMEKRMLVDLILYLMRLDESLDVEDAQENNIKIDELLELLDIPLDLDWNGTIDFLKEI